ncbi:putative 1,3-beta-glucan synthase [Medicago truncatula]|uniref:1,3-beta-glucan synthase n=1 Tax=Medicago truncatula TaxID=3880 RepID=A0A072VRY1_MEDTR|nr:callose synthase 9 [Medicago truncatula]XP_024628965.1 callose synthase 9 [Medicago truncatula]XP_024628977.1 callose synthase 9 [Medicago truncatula]KEH44542.1 callose synthase-like protein [Medicago truncatula]RHN82781.1 putative 1,3-beta-glucan synthase [Medicago truncatula]
MSRPEELWERLVRAALRRERTGDDAYGRPAAGIAGNVPSALAKNRDIDEILRVADEIQDEDPTVSRILCEHAYSLSQNLDPNSEGRGVLQFKTGLMSVIKQKLAKKEVGTIDRSQDIARLQEFYKSYRKKNNVDRLREEEMQLRESGAFSRNLGELERKTVKRKRVFATLKVLGTVLEQLSEEIPDELKRVMESDSASTEDLIAYNIIPIDATTSTNAIVFFPEVQAAVSALKYFSGLPELPRAYFISPTRNANMLDFLQYTFGFQKDNVANQHEHIVHLLANEQSRLGVPDKTEPKLDEAALQKVFLKSLDNYINWCNYLCIQPIWSSLEAVGKEKKLLYVSLYLLIWGEASNVRFLPECLCYIFHHMAREMDEILRQQIAQTANSCTSENGVSFLDHVILPLYDVISAEAASNDNGKASHSSWRNYDDFNEYFWSLHCFELSWPWRKSSSFFQKPQPRSKKMLSGRSQRQGKTSFVEHRTFFHLYHSFHRLWIFLFMMFQGLAIIAFNDGKFNSKTLREVLSLGPTFVVMKFFESVLDIFMMYGAYTTTRRSALSRIFLRFLWFSLASVFVTFLYVKALQDPNSVIFRLYVIIVGIYAGVQFFISFLMRIPACHLLTNQCDRWPLIRFVKWLRQERHYVGRGMYERSLDFIKYMLFWLVILSAKFSFAYFLQIKPLVKPTRDIIKENNIVYSWHDFVSKNNHNALTIVSVWAPVFFIYLLDIYVFYTLVSAVWGFLLGARARLGEIRSLEALQKLFEQFPGAFMDNLHVALPNRSAQLSSVQVVEKNKVDAARFSPFWNEIIRNLREEDYITNFELELLLMPRNSRDIPLVQWPLFLLASKIFLARDLAVESNKDTQDELWDRISRDDYMLYAVQECYYAVKHILTEVLDDAGRMWVERIYDDINASATKRSIHVDFRLNKLAVVISRITALMGILKETETPELERGAVRAVQDLYDVVRYDVLSIDMRDNYGTWSLLTKARDEGHLFQKLKWPNAELRMQVKRLYSLLTIKDSASSVPRNLEARRRLEFFANSLFMKMPHAKPVRQMLSFSVFTPYYSEIVLYSMDELLKKNEDGISILFYLQKIFPDEWKNFLARIGRDENASDTDLFDSASDILELRFWASYRGQTLARTVRGMMYYRKALMLQTYLERTTAGDLEAGVGFDEVSDTRGFDLSPEARAQADLKFTYVVTCQIYGKQKEEQKPEAVDIALLMQRNEALRVAFIDVVETLRDGKVNTEYYSKLVKADINGKDKEIYSVKLPGNPKLGEGKPENQNHAIIFTRGNAVQTIDMNQDNYFEEALKMRNLLEEFHSDHGLRPPTILGVREHVFTGSVSSLASFMSNQETSFVTLGQRVLANPLKVRMHYGHPDVFDRVFHITRGGISKASRVINISEDIYSGFNSTLRQGNITHHEYIQVGKGRDVGLNQIALFEGKVSSGNGEQVLSRDIYRLGQLFDFFRMMSFYFTTVGYYFCTMLTVLTVYAFLYGKTYLALSGVGEIIEERAKITKNTALSAALNTQFLFQIGIFTAVPMVLGFVLEQGFLRAVVNFITMQFQLCTVFFTFSLGTRTHYFGRTILHGGARYQATGRGFVVRHIKFSENYRLYSRSHFVKGLEVVLLLIVYLAYGYNDGGALSYILLSISSWFMALSWLFAPYLFNPSGFEWQKVVVDFRDWTNWLLYRGGIGVKGEESWEAWWEEELAHIRSLGSRIAETILSLRFFIFQYGIVYKLNIKGTDTSLTVYGLSWVVLAVLIILFKVFTFSQKISVNFQLVLRFVQGLSLLLALAGLVVAIILTDLSVPDVFASILAFIPTGWGILSIAAAWKPVMKRLGLWKFIRSLARLYDAGMGMLIFVPIAFFSWFPFVSTFQTRLMFNQAFSRGLEISLILAGNNPNTGI